jgi:hypothetical protein
MHLHACSVSESSHPENPIGVFMAEFTLTERMHHHHHQQRQQQQQQRQRSPALLATCPLPPSQEYIYSFSYGESGVQLELEGSSTAGRSSARFSSCDTTKVGI